MRRGQIVDIWYDEDEALVLVGQQVYRLSLVGRLIVEFCDIPREASEVTAHLETELGTAPAGAVESVIDQLISTGILSGA